MGENKSHRPVEHEVQPPACTWQGVRARSPRVSQPRAGRAPSNSTLSLLQHERRRGGRDVICQHRPQGAAPHYNRDTQAAGTEPAGHGAGARGAEPQEGPWSPLCWGGAGFTSALLPLPRCSRTTGSTPWCSGGSSGSACAWTSGRFPRTAFAGTGTRPSSTCCRRRGPSSRGSATRRTRHSSCSTPSPRSATAPLPGSSASTTPCPARPPGKVRVLRPSLRLAGRRGSPDPAQILPRSCPKPP